ncbi:MAG: PilZ domain-containing protein [Deltaproteobacteria bacterium]|nr:PilZ domain-containing protein [Deltaproteobacteria bacterium]
MIELRICPQCNKVFYSNSKESSPPCVYCGYVLIERCEERKEVSQDMTLTINGRKKGVTLKDYSPNGAMVVYVGSEIPVNTSFLFEIRELNIKKAAKIVWSKKINKSISATGIRFCR